MFRALLLNWGNSWLKATHSHANSNHISSSRNFDLQFKLWNRPVNWNRDTFSTFCSHLRRTRTGQWFGDFFLVQLNFHFILGFHSTEMHLLRYILSQFSVGHQVYTTQTSTKCEFNLIRLLSVFCMCVCVCEDKKCFWYYTTDVTNVVLEKRLSLFLTLNRHTHTNTHCGCVCMCVCTLLFCKTTGRLKTANVEKEVSNVCTLMWMCTSWTNVNESMFE